MIHARSILATALALLLGGCGAIWKVSYTFPGTVSLEVRADVRYPEIPLATQPAVKGN